ncbi:MAG: hypothetical protein J6M12_05805 [Clostridia bacterium]|nr:hypothetical protein [Clostridia bacterium]
MEEKKILGMKSKVYFGLSYLLMIFPSLDFVAAVIAVIALIKGASDTDEKRELVAIIVAWAVKFVLAFTVVAPAYVAGASIVVCIFKFQGKPCSIPGVYHIAKLIVK